MVFLIVILLHKWTGVIEPFADPSAEALATVKESLGIAVEAICPVFEEVVDTYMQDAQGTTDEKKRQALQKIQNESGGTLFPCPPPEDLLLLPSDLDKRIVGTLQFMFVKLAETKQKIIKSLNECPDGFQDMCSPEQEAIRDKVAQEKAQQASAASCQSPKEISTEDKDKILRQRSDAIQRAMTQGTVVLAAGFVSKTFPVSEAIVITKKLAEEIRTIKGKAERGELETNCKK